MSKEKKLEAFLKLIKVQARIDELTRTKTYHSNQTIYRKRLRILEDLENDLQEVVEGNDVESIKLTFKVPESVFKGKSEEDFVQYLKREYLVRD